MEKMKMETPDGTKKNIERIKALFPNVITEMKDEKGNLKEGIDFERLKQELSGDVVEGTERYDFTWVGKKAAILEAHTPIRKTLRPCIEESKDWETTENLYIEGDNLDVLKLLQESYLGKVKMIYIDPPYNTGNDFLYNDNFTMDKEEYEDQTESIDEEGHRLFRNTESNGRFHSDWCSMMYPRLKLARTLLSEDGVIFISVDDNEIDNIKKICNDIYGIDNFIATMVWKSKPQGGNDNKLIVTEHEYIIIYSKEINKVYLKGKLHDNNKYKNNDIHYEERGAYSLAKLDNSVLEYRINLDYPIECPDKSLIYPGGVVKEEWNKRKNGGNSKRDWQWRWSEKKYKEAVENDMVEFKYSNDKWKIYSKEYEKMDYNGKIIQREIKYRSIIDNITTINGTREFNKIFNERIFTYPKPIELIQKFIRMALDSGERILDFFSGSATTAHAVMQLNAEDGGNRKFIMVQLPEPCDESSEAFRAGYKNICEIGKERIRRAGEKIKEEIQGSNKQLKLGEEPKEVPDIGFRVFKADSTNMKDVYYAPHEYSQERLLDFESNIKEERTELDLLYGVLLEWGLPLSLKHEMETVEGIAVHTIDHNALIACFACQVPENVFVEIAKRQPLRAVFRDGSFSSGQDKINAWEIFKEHAPNTQIKVL